MTNEKEYAFDFSIRSNDTDIRIKVKNLKHLCLIEMILEKLIKPKLNELKELSGKE